jgi:hypothetical protein
VRLLEVVHQLAVQLLERAQPVLAHLQSSQHRGMRVNHVHKATHACPPSTCDQIGSRCKSIRQGRVKHASALP